MVFEGFYGILEDRFWRILRNIERWFLKALKGCYGMENNQYNSLWSGSRDSSDSYYLSGSLSKLGISIRTIVNIYKIWRKNFIIIFDDENEQECNTTNWSTSNITS